MVRTITASEYYQALTTVVGIMARKAFVALRVYTIWDHRASVRIILCVALAIVHIPVFVLGIESVITYTRS